MESNGNKHPALLRVEGLGYQVDGQVLLSDINFEITAGERIAIFGPSGAGKSTLIRLMNRLDEPSSGTVYLEGQDYRQISPRKLRRRLGMVMQQPNLFPGSVAENIRFGPTAQGERLDDERLRELLLGVDLEGFADRDVSKLSGGEAQRVNLARTLANKPEVLLLDEPTSSLDQAAKQEVEETILSVLESGEVTCILVSHDRTQVMRMTDRVLSLKDGRLIADGPAEEVLNAQSMD
ncbi:MAG: phosphate ABC transporter ATP-binding protein [Chloroflexota bacterium]|nr:phosphate ABC transporter ATP-binding protein [Chloroflexota bacterium]